MTELDKIFIGREQEMETFRRFLTEFRNTPSSETRPMVILMWGLGGIGKSSLTRKFVEISNEKLFRDLFAVERLDWELFRELDTKRFAIEREKVAAEDVLDGIVAYFEQGERDSAFSDYRKAKDQRIKAEAELAKLLQPGGDSQLAPVSGLATRGIGALIRWGGRWGKLDEESKEVAKVVEKYGESTIKAALAEIERRIKREQLDFITEPDVALARALGRCLKQKAIAKPIVLILDTYEIVEGVDMILRQVMMASGERLMWVLSGRDPLGPSHYREQKVGYDAQADDFQLRKVPEVTEFSQNDVAMYVKRAAPTAPLPTDGAERIHKATFGIPLAVKIAAEIWSESQNLRDIEPSSGKNPKREKIVSLLTERFLTHCPNATERQQIYALALLRRIDELGPLDAMLGRESESDSAIRTLASRYSFIFAQSYEHDSYVHREVRDALIERIRLDAPVRNAIKPMLKRAWQWGAERLAEREDWSWEDRVDSDSWQRDALDYLYYRLWEDMESGFMEIPAFFLAGLAYDTVFARAVLSLAEEIDTGDSRKRKRLIEAWESLVGFWWNDNDRRAEGIRSLSKAWRKLPLPPRDDKELETILKWQAAKIDLEQKDDNADRAGKALLSIIPQLSDEWEQLRERVADSLVQAGRKLLWPHGARYAVATPHAAPLFDAAFALKDWRGSSSFWHFYSASLHYANRAEEAVTAGQKAINIDPYSAMNHIGLGIALSDQGQFDAAITAYDQAIQLDPGDATAHNNLGNALSDQGQLDAAIAAFNQAIQLDPSDAIAHYNLGNALSDQGQLDEAMAAYNQAIQLDPKNAAAHIGLGIALSEQGQLDAAIAAYNQAIQLDPGGAIAHNNLGLLLADQARKAGDSDALQRHVDQVRALLAADDHYGRACVESVAGNTDQALDFLARAIEDDSSRKDWAKQDPDLAWIRDDPRFAEIVGE